MRRRPQQDQLHAVRTGAPTVQIASTIASMWTAPLVEQAVDRGRRTGKSSSNRDMELSPADRDAAIAVLRRCLTPAALRSVIRQESTGRRRKGVEWIIAEVESRNGRLSSRLPDAALAPFLVDLKGADLL